MLNESSKSLQNVKEFVQPEGGIIKTSYMYQDLDYNVEIKYPYFEYHNTYKSVVITRPLITEDDYALFFKTTVLLSTEWASYALKWFTNYSQFNMFLNSKKWVPVLSQFNSPIKPIRNVPVLVTSRDES